MNTEQHKTLAAYCRVGHHDEWALTQQMSIVREFALKHTGREVTLEYFDACSGNPNRGKGLHNLLLAAQQRQFDTLVVYSATRIARDPRQVWTIIAELAQNGVCVKSVLQDTSLLEFLME